MLQIRGEAQYFSTSTPTATQLFGSSFSPPMIASKWVWADVSTPDMKKKEREGRRTVTYFEGHQQKRTAEEMGSFWLLGADVFLLHQNCIWCKIMLTFIEGINMRAQNVN